MSRVRALALSACLAAATAISPARADDTAAFMSRFSGLWVGTGQLLFVADNNAEFLCELKGSPSPTQLTFGMTGTCRMGSLSAPIRAQLRYNAETDAFYGQFLDGAEGDGVDLVGTRAGDGFSLKLVRGQAQGRLAAEAVDRDQLKVVIYYRDPRNDAEVPVVAMGLTRKEILGSAQP
jgi:hypothetical protein